MLDPNKPHPFKPDLPNSAIWCWCGRSNSRYARKFHTPPFQVEADTTDPRILAWRAKPANSAPVSTDIHTFTDHSFAARMQRLSELNRPAVSTSTGGEPENPNQEDNTMKLNLTVTLDGVDRILPLMKAINGVSGVTLDDLVEAVEKTPSDPLTRTSSAAKRALLSEAARENKYVVIDYVDRFGVTTSGRRVMPILFEDDVLIGRDTSRSNAVRRFLLSRIDRVGIEA